METKEVLVISAMILLGFGLLTLILGIQGALYLSALVIGGWLFITGLGIIGEMIHMRADESISKAKAERHGQMHSEMMLAAIERKNFIMNGRKEVIDI
jgi:divalent metal cation (Fe/Co/Zn/Cd) transporter